MSNPEKRKELDNILLNLIGNGKVYFQPPKNTKIEYPCIIYHLVNGDSVFADDKSYMFNRRYEIQYITKNPDDVMIDKIAMELPKTIMTNQYTVEGLYHNVYNTYY